MPKDIPSRIWLLQPNADGTLDSRYPNGDKPVGGPVVAPTITLGTITSTSIQILISGGSNISLLTPRCDEALLPAIPVNTTSYTFFGLDADTEYSLDLRSDGDGGPVFSNALITETAAGAPLTPTAHISFDGLSNFERIGEDALPGDQLFTYWAAYSEGYGTCGDTTIAPDGYSSSARMSIQEGTSGRHGDGYNPGGDFGGILVIPEGIRPGQGQEIRMAFRLRVPIDFNYSTTDALKFIRMNVGDESDEREARMDFPIYSGHFDQWNDWIPGPGPEMVGVSSGSEWIPSNVSDLLSLTDRIIPRTQWVIIEVAVKLHADWEQSWRRMWINKLFVTETVPIAGEQVRRWIDNTGLLQSHTIPVAFRANTLPLSTDIWKSFMLFTYWNGGAPQDQYVNVSDIAYHIGTTGLSQTDQFGNLMMGDSWL